MGWLGRLFGKSEKPPRELTERERIDAVDRKRAAARQQVWTVVRAGRGIEIARAQSATLAAANQLVERVQRFVGCDAATVKVSEEPGEWEVEVAKGGRRESARVQSPRPDWRWIDRHELDEQLVRAFDRLFDGADRRLYLADVAEHEDDARGALLYLTLDEARALEAAGAFLVPSPPTPEDLAMHAEEDAEDERAERERAAREAEAEEEAEEDEVEAAVLRLDDLVESLEVVGDTVVMVAEDELVAVAALGTGARRTLPIEARAIARHRDRLYVGDAGGTVHVLDAALREVTSRRVADHAIYAIAAGDGAVLVSHEDSDDLVVLDPIELVERRRLRGSNAQPFGLCALPGGRCGGGDQTPVHYRIWDADGRELASVAIPDATTTMGAALSPDGMRLAVVADQRGVLLDAVTLEKVADLPSGWACAWTPAGTLVVGHLEELRELDRDGDELARVDPFDGDAHNVSALASLDDGRIVAGFERGQIWIGAVRG